MGLGPSQTIIPKIVDYLSCSAEKFLSTPRAQCKKTEVQFANKMEVVFHFAKTMEVVFLLCSVELVLLMVVGLTGTMIIELT